MKPNCEYCGAVLPEGVDKQTRQVRSAHFTQHAAEREQQESGVHFTAHNTLYKQPEALRLADKCLDCAPCREDVIEAAAELRRLHALCDEMCEALGRAVEREYNGFEPNNQSAEYYTWSALVAKWKESK